MPFTQGSKARSFVVLTIVVMSDIRKSLRAPTPQHTIPDKD